MTVPETVGVEFKTLIDLAHDKSKQGRAALVTAITQLFDGQGLGLTAQDREMMTDIIVQVIKDVEASVRRSLADHFAERSDAPENLVIALANDDIEVAHPVLLRSKVLHDAELIEIVQHRTMEHQVAIAGRPLVSERVSDALVETGNDKVVTTLLENDGARTRASTEILDWLSKQRNVAWSGSPAVGGELVINGLKVQMGKDIREAAIKAIEVEENAQ